MGMKVVYTCSELELDPEILLVAEWELKNYFSRLITCSQQKMWSSLLSFSTFKYLEKKPNLEKLSVIVALYFCCALFLGSLYKRGIRIFSYEFSIFDFGA